MRPIFRRTSTFHPTIYFTKFISSFATHRYLTSFSPPRLTYSIKGARGVPLTLKTQRRHYPLAHTIAVSPYISVVHQHRFNPSTTKFTILYMASTKFALVDAKKSILEDGFFFMDDSVVGEHVLEMQQKDFPFVSEYGLEFCKLNVLNNTVGKREKCSYSY